MGTKEEGDGGVIGVMDIALLQFLSEPADRAYRVWGEANGRNEQKIKRKVQNKSSILFCTFLFYSAIIKNNL